MHLRVTVDALRDFIVARAALWLCGDINKGVDPPITRFLPVNARSVGANHARALRRRDRRRNLSLALTRHGCNLRRAPAGIVLQNPQHFQVHTLP